MDPNAFLQFLITAIIVYTFIEVASSKLFRRTRRNRRK